jgi:hypothetical protein
MKLLDAAEKALRDTGRPMRSTEIVALAIRKRWIHPKGKTPEHSLQAALWADINNHGSRSRFKIIGDVPIRKRYALRKP